MKAKLDEMEQSGIIVKVPEPTRRWSKLGHGDLQVCLDPTDLNKAVLPEYHLTPFVEDIVLELNGLDLFSKLVVVPHTTFSTPFAKYRYTRFPFGLREL